jgi:ferredoxin
MNTEEKYRKAAEAINAAGGTPLPVTDTLLEILKLVIAEQELDFIIAFSEKRSQTVEQLLGSTGLGEPEIKQKAAALASRGVIFDQPNRKGVVVYRLLPLVNVGIFEYMFMKKLERSETDKKIANLFTKLFDEIRGLIQSNYEGIVATLDQWPPVDRTVPALDRTESGEPVTIQIDETLAAPVDRVLPAQKVEEIIAKFDEIAVGHCFCRHHKDMMDSPCKQTKDRENCFTFGKSARYTSSQGFSRLVSRDEALEILKRAEEDGLVHKAYHPNFDVSKEETSICNCCKCCCGQAVANLIAPTINTTNYLARVDPEVCVGCGTCVEHCHTGAISINADKKAEHVDSLCIGCGLCATHCSQNAVALIAGERIVRIPPPRRQAAG